MSSILIPVKGGFSFEKALEEAKKHYDYYEEGLFVTIAERVVDAMHAKRVSRSELARRLKVSPAYVTKILRGHANLSLESLAKVAFALNLKWECLLIPLKSELGLFALGKEDGGVVIRSEETAFIQGFEDVQERNDSMYEKGENYELLHTA